MNKATISTAVIALVIGFGGGYVAHSSPAQAQNGSGVFTRNGGASGAMRGGFLSGTVAMKDAGSITIDTRDGSSRVVLISPATNVSKSVAGSESDISVGSDIIVSGTTNSDGSISASLIQLRPAAPSAAQ